ncbi:PTS glucose/sucrose transporter subunit IIB [Paratractidigestivibacter sp.]|uniref:PTS glucose/sucrose transporter subunit IIB n=1 Tax=Paratractidigestivibacter sp. TaxID=2847316 RepID=UPI002ABDAFD0|nr:PTS glucose/sucrose transporter subunit IIB [Paratractidigestivibacter sp.]
MASIFERISDAFKSNDDDTVKEAVLASASAVNILNAVGGADNVKAATNCATRLRLKLKDPAKVDYAACMNAGALGVVKPEDEKNGLHVILGTSKVQNVTDAFKKLL